MVSVHVNKSQRTNPLGRQLHAQDGSRTLRNNKRNGLLLKNQTNTWEFNNNHIPVHLMTDCITFHCRNSGTSNKTFHIWFIFPEVNVFFKKGILVWCLRSSPVGSLIPQNMKTTPLPHLLHSLVLNVGVFQFSNSASGATKHTVCRQTWKRRSRAHVTDSEIVSELYLKWYFSHAEVEVDVKCCGLALRSEI